MVDRTCRSVQEAVQQASRRTAARTRRGSRGARAGCTSPRTRGLGPRTRVCEGEVTVRAPIEGCTCTRQPPLLGPAVCPDCKAATVQINAPGGARVVCARCVPEWAPLIEHEKGCPRRRSSTPTAVRLRNERRCGGIRTVPVPWDERLSQAFLLDYRTREDLIREARLTPGEVEAADRCGRLPRSSRKS